MLTQAELKTHKIQCRTMSSDRREQLMRMASLPLEQIGPHAHSRKLYNDLPPMNGILWYGFSWTTQKCPGDLRAK